MISLIGSVIGFTTGFLPEVLNFFKRKQEHAQKLEMMRLQLEMAGKRSELRLLELDREADIAAAHGIYDMIEALTLENLSMLFGAVFVLLLLMPSF